MTEESIPVPQDSDHETVKIALQTAAALWKTDAAEALRWLRKAAEGASDHGDDMRSVQLARTAADLRTAAALPPSHRFPFRRAA